MKRNGHDADRRGTGGSDAGAQQKGPQQRAAQNTGKRPTGSPTAARSLALEVTRLVRTRGAFAHNLVEKKVRPAKLPQQERDFATLLILGVVATSGELDFLLNRALIRGAIKPDLRDALRISVYELVFLKKEAHVAISQGVELVRSFAPHATGFANRLLRQVARLAEDWPFGSPQTSTEALAHSQAFPLWLAERLVAELGREGAAAFMEASNLQAPVYLASVGQGDRQAVEQVTERGGGQNAELGTVPADGEQDAEPTDRPTASQSAPQSAPLKIAPAQLTRYLARIEAGELIVADASAQQVAAIATPSPNGAFLEVGSGRGTKTVLLQHNSQRRHGRQVPIFALDNRGFKQGILAERIERYHLEAVTPVTGDALQLDALVAAGALPPLFASALIDAPCSGSGTLRRHPEIRWRLTPADVTALAAQSLALLRATAAHIADGGFIVYSTCSVFYEENEAVIAAFLATPEGKPFRVEPIGDAPPPPATPGATGVEAGAAVGAGLAGAGAGLAGAAIAAGLAGAAVGAGAFFRPSLTSNSPDVHFAAKLVKKRVALRVL